MARLCERGILAKQVRGVHAGDQDEEKMLCVDADIEQIFALSAVLDRNGEPFQRRKDRGKVKVPALHCYDGFDRSQDVKVVGFGTSV